MIGSIISGLVGKSGAEAGGNAAGGAADQASGMMLQEAQRSRSALSPWTSSGTSALGKITQLLGLGTLTQAGNNQGNYWVDPTNAKGVQDEALNAFQTSPGYSWRKTEGINALDRSAAAKGLLLSGAQVKGVQSFGDGLASEEYRNYIGDLSNLYGAGGSATASANGTSGSLVAGAGNATMQGGVARGSGYAAGANALASGIGQGVNNALFMATYGMSGGKKKPGGDGVGTGTGWTY